VEIHTNCEVKGILKPEDGGHWQVVFVDNKFKGMR
jgi:stress-induced morphogen